MRMVVNFRSRSLLIFLIFLLSPAALTAMGAPPLRSTYDFLTTSTLSVAVTSAMSFSGIS